MTYSQKAQRVPGSEKKEIIAQRGKFYTAYSIGLIEPSPQYPTPMVAFTYSSGDDYTYSQIRIEEFDYFLRALQDAREKFEELMPELRKKEAVYAAAKAQQDAIAAQAREWATGQSGEFDAAAFMKILEQMKNQAPPQIGGH